MRSALCWLRRDLRLADNTALALATERAERVAVVFVFDTNILDTLPDKDDTRVSFIVESVDELDRRLRDLGSRLIVLHGDPALLIPRLAAALEVDAVFASHDDDPYAIQRDTVVGLALAKQRVDWITVKDHVIFERREVLNGSGEPFKVFTPYCRAWKGLLEAESIAEHKPVLTRLWRDPRTDLLVKGDLWEEIGFTNKVPWTPGGETAAEKRLSEFERRIDSYAAKRDFPAEDATSHLSVHLRHGTLSIRQCVRTALSHKSTGATKWLDELVWREFYHMILSQFPHVASSPFRPEYKDVAWPGDLSHYEAWEQGKTGYPLVDAAMRCLNATGWMHNRLRMVTAMFLTKDLLLDYRLGERHFARFLLDFELASNNGGWQWSASTGVDAQPWFRIFNPVTQSRKFDPSGAFIRKWCPELGELDDDSVHWPHDSLAFALAEGYPKPVVDHKVQRELALKVLSSVAKQS